MNFLPTTRFQFVLQRCPNVSFFVQTATLPGMTLNPTLQPTPFRDTRFAGDRVELEPLTISIRMDENMEAYFEIAEWMQGLSRYESYDDYKNLSTRDGLYSDASLIILNSRNNPNIEFTIQSIFPSNLGAIQFNALDTDTVYATCDVTFEHNGVSAKRIPKL